MTKHTRRASGAEQRDDWHRASSHSAGRPKECDDEGRYIDPRLLTGPGFEAFSFDNGSSAHDHLPCFGTPSSEEPALSYYNPDHQEAAGFFLNGEFPLHPYVTSVSGDHVGAYNPFGTEERLTYIRRLSRRPRSMTKTLDVLSTPTWLVLRLTTPRTPQPGWGQAVLNARALLSLASSLPGW